jgi:hypothetical protein
MARGRKDSWLHFNTDCYNAQLLHVHTLNRILSLLNNMHTCSLQTWKTTNRQKTDT